MGAVAHDPDPEHVVVQAHDVLQSIPPAQLPLPVHRASQAPVPQLMVRSHEPSPPQVMLHAVAALQSTPPSQAPVPPQLTWQS